MRAFFQWLIMPVAGAWILAGCGSSQAPKLESSENKVEGNGLEMSLPEGIEKAESKTSQEQAVPPVQEAPMPPEFQEAYAAAVQFFNQGQFDQALEKLKAADAVVPDNPAVLNLRGAVYVRLQKLDEAAGQFKMLTDKFPDNSISIFNLAEVYFLKKDYAQSKEWFSKFLAAPANKGNALGRYKVILCDIMLGNQAQVNEALSGLTPTISNPLYYYANAAECFKKGRTEEAREYVQSAFGIYAGGMNAAFADSLIELGWLDKGEIAQIGAVDAAALQSLSNEFQPGGKQAASQAKKEEERSRIESLLPSFGKDDDKGGQEESQ